ncbi:hypothetical protein TWF694_002699 [Orbilia ellipsospora]|uniref:Uncharacterized protein n=1 Tax=Orbilia ellipsospora TaxID=2528407 RepID=A0AAV9X2Q0_9PEZI
MPLLDNVTLELSIGTNNGNNDGNGNSISNKGKAAPVLNNAPNLPKGSTGNSPVLQARPNPPGTPVSPSIPNVPVSIPNAKVQRRGGRRLIARNPFLKDADIAINIGTNNGNNDGNGNNIANKGGENITGNLSPVDKSTDLAMPGAPAVPNALTARNTPKPIVPDVRVKRHERTELTRRGPFLGTVGLHVNIGTGNGNNDGNGNSIHNSVDKEGTIKSTDPGSAQSNLKHNGSVIPKIQTSLLSTPTKPTNLGATAAPQSAPIKAVRHQNSRRRVPNNSDSYNSQGRHFARGFH